MTIKHRTKMSRYRGRKTHGWGHKKKHRGKGSSGGKGYGGTEKHKFSLVVTKKKDHFGSKGFHTLQKVKKTINIGDIEKVTGESTINLKTLGFDKLLSRGTVTRPVTITVEKYSKRAKEKIEQAGGKIISGKL